MSFRTLFLTGSIATASLGFAGAGLTQSASAQNLAFGSQAEWVQNYEAVSRTQVSRSATPILSQETLAATEALVDRYRDIVARGRLGPDG